MNRTCIDKNVWLGTIAQQCVVFVMSVSVKMPVNLTLHIGIDYQKRIYTIKYFLLVDRYHVAHSVS